MREVSGTYTTDELVRLDEVGATPGHVSRRARADGMVQARCCALPAATTHQYRFQLVLIVAGTVMPADRWVVGQVTITESHQREQDLARVPAVIGQQVLESRRSLAVLAALDQPGMLQRPQALGQQVPWRAGGLGDAVEPVRPEDQLAEHQQ